MDKRSDRLSGTSDPAGIVNESGAPGTNPPRPVATAGQAHIRRIPCSAGTGARFAQKILFAVAEAYPFIKTGGLADAAASLCRALHERGFDIRIALPAYRIALEKMQDRGTTVELEGLPAPGPVRILETTLPDTMLPVYLIDAPALFDRPGTPYQDADGRDWPDNAARFALYCRVIELMGLGRAGLDWSPDLLHCNDWHTGLAPALLSRLAARPACVFTIHSLAYQGNFPFDTFRALDLPAEFRGPDGLEFHGMLSFIKGGLAYADRLITVSPTFAEEITTPGHGFGLDGLLRHRRGALSGILNGVDYRIWDPRADPHIARGFWTNRLGGKRDCKLALQRELGLHEKGEAVVLAHIARLTHQKGADLVLAALPELLALPEVQLVMLGSGDAWLQDALRAAAVFYPGRIGAHIGFNEGLAHRLVAGSDILLMPSRFEPCGLTQLYALRYGTVPVVRRTGGLADTVIDATERNLRARRATGFFFDHPEPRDCIDAVRRAVTTCRDEGALWRQIMRTGMQQDFSWEKSAARYAEIYAELTHEKRGRSD